MKPNTHYQALEDSYLFSTIARKVTTFQAENPSAKVIRLGIGDVTMPLCPAVVQALESAAREMGSAATFRGYGPEQGYDFLKSPIGGYYAARGIALDEGEIFVSDGAKSDVGNFLDLLDKDNTVLIPDPVYPVYRDTNLMDGRTILFMDANQQNGFLPLPDPAVDADIIYLCSPNNPTGAVYDRAALEKWVAYALSKNALILFDAAYEAFIQTPGLPRSIFEIEGARNCAVEFCSLSKTAGFTGVRCGYTIVPKELSFGGMSLNRMWLRRQTTKFNGVSYIVQRGAAAAFSPEGLTQTRAAVDAYMQNAAIIASTLKKMDIWFTGGENAPYIWLRCPGDMDSWAFFDHLLQTKHIVGTPGAGFGQNGAKFFRLTAFGTREATQEAMQRLLAE